MDPVFIDLETRSACNLPLEGGWKYAKHESTRLLTVSWCETLDVFHLWFPGMHEAPPKANLTAVLGDSPPILHYGRECPEALRALTHRPWVAHNAWTFDELVWRALMPDCEPVAWIDTYPLSLAAGLPGGLDAIGKMLWGEGKYTDGKAACKTASISGHADSDADNVKVGTQLLVGRYNVQDVKLLADLYPVLTRECVQTDEEKSVLAAHKVINARGVKIDRGMIVALVALDDAARGHAVKEIARLTGGALPDIFALRSRPKVFAWLQSCGVKFGTSLRKDIVARFIDAHKDEAETEAEEDTSDPDEAAEDAPKGLLTVVQVLQLRMQALRITGGKLDAALWTMDDLHRARGLFAYHAAGPGRWGGRKIQVQNLPKPKTGVDVWALRALYDFEGKLEYDRVKSVMYDAKARKNPHAPEYRFLSVDDAASALIRMSLLPDEGKVLAAGDLAQIECRMLAWLAGEKWLLRAFWDDSDPYVQTAERIFGEKASWPGGFSKKHDYRQVGKIVELGCLAEGTPILTNRGWVEIENVALTDLLWDGADWVAHKGVVCSGEKLCRNVNGVWMTDNHKVWTDGGWVGAGALPESGPSLSGRYSVTGLFFPLFSVPVEACNTSPPSVSAVPSVTQQSATYLPEVRPDATSVQRRRRVRLSPFTSISARTLHTGIDYSTESAPSSVGATMSPTRDMLTTARGVCEWMQDGFKIVGVSSHTFSPYQGGTTPHSRLTESEGTKGTSPATCDSPPAVCRTRIVARTYDILLAGGRSAFQAGGLIVHNSGYQLGAGKMAVYAASAGIDLDAVGTTPQACITAYRSTHPAIAGEQAGVRPDGVPWFRGGYWNQCQDACVSVCADGGSIDIGPVTFAWEKPNLVIVLPSGRRLVYRHARVEWQEVFGRMRPYITYTSPRYGRVKLYGGKIVENIVQGVSRDVLAHAMVLMERAGLSVNLHCHDEAVASIQPTQFDLFMRLLTTCPVWLTDFPLDAEGGLSYRYAKTAPPGGREYVYRNGARHG